jgi:hypothetical protein
MFTLTGELAAHTRSILRALATGVLAGGVLVAPLLVVCGLLCLFAPLAPEGRHIAPALIVVALLWLLVAIFGAHARSSPGADEDDPTP